ncbi:GntR family transcriptional regulator [Yoonia sp. SS1-5]|uniref:GntR family transcriptional regulator n=1 Tax=Yoonia rhodophyticola TaxID=3137370 RepID=A0AAN0NIW1_9RHOB
MNKNLKVDAETTTPKLTDAAYDALEHMIVTGELAPGRWVSEAELMAASGFTRAPIRAAMQKLATQQLIVIYPRRGAQICPLDFTQQFRVLELRREVESLLIRSATRRATDQQRARFAEMAEVFRAAALNHDQQQTTAFDIEFFKLLYAAADNQFVEAAMLSIKGLSRRFWILHQEKFGDGAYLAECSAAMAQAVADGDLEEAAKTHSAVLDYIERFTLEVVGYSHKK